MDRRRLKFILTVEELSGWATIIYLALALVWTGVLLERCATGKMEFRTEPSFVGRLFYGNCTRYRKASDV